MVQAPCWAPPQDHNTTKTSRGELNSMGSPAHMGCGAYHHHMEETWSHGQDPSKTSSPVLRKLQQQPPKDSPK